MIRLKPAPAHYSTGLYFTTRVNAVMSFGQDVNQANQ
jgi:hypothetical protein